MALQGKVMTHPFRNRWVLGLSVFVLTAASYAQWSNPADDIPAYHPSAPLKVSSLPPILAAAQFQFAWQKRVYEQAAKVSSVIYQLPCNCRCDRVMGHTSLRSCFETTHGAECSTCAQEGLYAYQQTRLGKTPAQIRAGIERHEYESIDFMKQ